MPRGEIVRVDQDANRLAATGEIRLHAYDHETGKLGWVRLADLFAAALLTLQAQQAAPAKAEADRAD